MRTRPTESLKMLTLPTLWQHWMGPVLQVLVEVDAGADTVMVVVEAGAQAGLAVARSATERTK